MIMRVIVVAAAILALGAGGGGAGAPPATHHSSVSERLTLPFSLATNSSLRAGSFPLASTLQLR